MTITLTREEAQQVLDALDEYRDSTEDFRVANRCILLIQTLRARLSAPEPSASVEPVAWFMKDHVENKAVFTSSKEVAAQWKEKGWPVGLLYPAPPKREFVGLRDKELFEIWVKSPAETDDRFAFARAIEAKLKEKNT